MEDKFRDEKTDLLFDSILALDNREECYALFLDLCTKPEIQEMSKRIYAAKLLSEKHSYNEIAEKTGLSTATISRVNTCLKFGSGGYSTVLEKIGTDLEKENE